MTNGSMDLPAGDGFRPPTLDDLDAVGGVLVADLRESADEPVLDADFIRQVWSRPDFDLLPITRSRSPRST